MAAVLATAVLAAAARPAHASRFLRIGIYDEAQTLYGPVVAVPIAQFLAECYRRLSPTVIPVVFAASTFS